MDVSTQKNQLYTLDKPGDGQDPSLKPLSTYISEAYNDYKKASDYSRKIKRAKIQFDLINKKAGKLVQKS